MRTLTRLWSALFAWGSGLVHLALGAGAGLGGAGNAAVVTMVALLALGAGELAWGTASIRAGRPVVPRTAAVGALAGVLLAPVAIAVGCSPVAVAASLVLAVSAIALSANRRTRGTPPPRPWSAALAMVAGAVLVAAVVTPALSTTDAPAHVGELPGGGQGIHSGH
ncbi:hypothetical protein L2X99_04420 [Microbacterium sp. KUDC0406]|uniref:hypothetical protein n=1 Tax=Microbacterium sp. KUDC0406 TaxID=2909588 RepID=UPI001F4593E5|nr:hypothetical protein [Microbacterium sp. KUDC0406]UJP10877.1 hypothetical protein L2X99_04420 [Microbacterium sp. KUDC0406]